MTTILLSETRKLGVSHLAQLLAPIINNSPDEANFRKKTQTEVIYQNGDRVVVVSTADHLRDITPRNGDQAVVIGAISGELLRQLENYYKASQATIVINQGEGGVILTPTELRKRALRQQMEDLDKEELLGIALKNLNIPGVIFTKFKITTGTNRSFTINVDGSFIN